MELGEFTTILETAVAGRETLVAFLHCEITYSGRAEAFIGRGDRVLLLKADGAILLHRPEGGNPVNYMRAGSTVAMERVDGHLLLHVINSADKSFLDIEVYQVYDAASRKLEDGQKQDLAGNERDMSDHIRNHPELIAPDFKPISREEQTDVGFLDVFGHDNAGRLVVVECKRVTASLGAVDQLRRYVERVQQIRGTSAVTGVLAAPGITPNARNMLESYGYRYAHIHPPKRLERWHSGQKKIAEF